MTSLLGDFQARLAESLLARGTTLEVLAAILMTKLENLTPMSCRIDSFMKDKASM